MEMKLTTPQRVGWRDKKEDRRENQRFSQEGIITGTLERKQNKMIKEIM